MKKIVLVITLILSIILITGCGVNSKNGGGSILNPNKTMNCTKESVDEDGYKTFETMNITYNSTKVLRVKSTNISETDPTYIDFGLSIGTALASKLSEINGMTMEYTKDGDNKIKIVMDVDFTKIDPAQIKEVFGELYNEEDSFYNKKDYTIEQFKKENLSGYNCK